MSETEASTPQRSRSRLPISRSRTRRRLSMASDSSESSSPEQELYDDGDSIMQQANDSQSSLGVSLDEMDLESTDTEAQQALWRASPISRLPSEILISIFSRLSSAGDIKNCMLVSKSWAANSVDLLWHRPDTRDWKNLMMVVQTTRKPNGTFAYHDLIRRLNLAQLGDLVSDGTLEPLSSCKRIERLTLTNCRYLTDLSVEALIDGNRNLLAIDVSHLDKITDASLIAVANNCYKLQGLNVTRCTHITDESLVAIARNCRRVKRLKFNDCAQLTDYSILAFADNCHDILEIDCAGCVNLTDMSVTALITQGRQLRELRLQQCARVTDEAFLSLPHDQTFEALRILDLTECDLLQDAGLHKIVTAAPRLRNLVLAKCRQITDRGLTSVIKLGKNLHYIHLGHCSRITDFGVVTLIRHCNRIRYIDLACCQHLTDASVAMLSLLPKLKRIGLVKCQLITDESIKALAAPRHHSHNMLERLHLSYCTLLTVEGVRKMLFNCPRLTHLSLTGVNEFLAPQYIQFCREAPHEFNEHQREMFCVYSGDGVSQLREFLRQQHHPSRHEHHNQDYDSDATVVVPQNPPPAPTIQPQFTHPAPPHQFPIGGLTGLFHPQMAALPPAPATGAWARPRMPLRIQQQLRGDRAANRPPPPPPSILVHPLHGPLHTQQLPQGVITVMDEDEDFDEDMGGGEE